jgi:hypothetical protein
MVSRWLIAIVLLVMAVPVQSVSAAGENDYEIPLSELKKVEKKKLEKRKPKKVESRKRKERKKAETTSQETPSEFSGAAAAPGQPAPLVPETDLHGEEIMGTQDNDHISHDPYSYVVPGKRTVVKAIIGREAVQSVKCRFRSLDKGGYASVTMAQAPGSQFTYVATLPALEPGAALLRYRFIVVGASGIQTYSREFVIPVKPTSVMPGWQQDPAREPVRATLENRLKPLEGFSDVVIEDADRK